MTNVLREFELNVVRKLAHPSKLLSRFLLRRERVLMQQREDVLAGEREEQKQQEQEEAESEQRQQGEAARAEPEALATAATAFPGVLRDDRYSYS